MKIRSLATILIAALFGQFAAAQSLLGFNNGDAPFYSTNGTFDSPTAPEYMSVLLDGPAVSDIFVPITSDAPSVLTVSGGANLCRDQI